MASAAGTPNYVCSSCDHVFTGYFAKNNYRRHLRNVHNAESVIHCRGLCNREFVQRGAGAGDSHFDRFVELGDPQKPTFYDPCFQDILKGCIGDRLLHDHVRDICIIVWGEPEMWKSLTFCNERQMARIILKVHNNLLQHPQHLGRDRFSCSSCAELRCLIMEGISPNGQLPYQWSAMNGLPSTLRVPDNVQDAGCFSILDPQSTTPCDNAPQSPDGDSLSPLRYHAASSGGATVATEIPMPNSTVPSAYFQRPVVQTWPLTSQNEPSNQTSVAAGSNMSSTFSPLNDSLCQHVHGINMACGSQLLGMGVTRSAHANNISRDLTHAGFTAQSQMKGKQRQVVEDLDLNEFHGQR